MLVACQLLWHMVIWNNGPGLWPMCFQLPNNLFEKIIKRLWYRVFWATQQKVTCCNLYSCWSEIHGFMVTKPVCPSAKIRKRPQLQQLAHKLLQFYQLLQQFGLWSAKVHNVKLQLWSAKLLLQKWLWSPKRCKLNSVDPAFRMRLSKQNHLSVLTVEKNQGPSFFT